LSREKCPFSSILGLITYFISLNRGGFSGFEGFETQPIQRSGYGRRRTAASKVEFQRLADVLAEAKWFANLKNENTKRAYRHDVTSFMRFVGIKRPEDFRTAARAHVIAWRKVLEKKNSPVTVRRKLSALSDLYDYLCEKTLCHIIHCVVWSAPKKARTKAKHPPFRTSKRRHR